LKEKCLISGSLLSLWNDQIFQTFQESILGTENDPDHSKNGHV